MKKNRSLLPVLLAVLVSCSVEQETEDQSDGTVRLSLRLESSPPSVKGATRIDEYSIGSVRVLEFNSKGDILYDGTVSRGGDMSFPVQKDHPLDIYLVANDGTGNLDGVLSKNDFLSRQVSYDDMDKGQIAMLGHLAGTFTKDSTVEVRMERLLAKIVLDTIIFKISHNLYDYYLALPNKAYMAKSPRAISFGLLPSDTYENADKSGMEDWGWSRGDEDYDKYQEGDCKVWEWTGSRSVYAIPNPSVEEHKRSVLALDYIQSYVVRDYIVDGQYHLSSRRSEKTLRLVLPPVRPNTSYELKKIVINGTAEKIINLSARERTSGTSECEFTLRDLTTGENLGTEKGEVWYEIPGV